MTRSLTHDALTLAEIAVFVHGVLASFHCLGILYNAKRRNPFDTLVHTLGVCYDLHAVRTHLRAVRLLQVPSITPLIS